MLNIESEGKFSFEKSFSLCETTFSNKWEPDPHFPSIHLLSSKLIFTSFGPMWKNKLIGISIIMYLKGDWTRVNFKLLEVVSIPFLTEKPASSFWMILFSSNASKHVEDNFEKWLILPFYLLVCFYCKTPPHLYFFFSTSHMPHSALFKEGL